MSGANRLTVSVIIPTYNRARLVGEAIDSLLNQTRTPDEIVVVDDGSTDDTAGVLAHYGDSIQVITQANQGLARARNAGLRAATGDLIAFLDSDDTLLPASIERRAQVLETKPDIGVVYSNVMVVNMQGKPVGLYTAMQPGHRPSGMIFAELARYNLMPPLAFMLRASCLQAVGVFAEDVPGVEDYDLWLRLAAHYRFQYLDEPLACYRVHDGMMNVTNSRMMKHSDLDVHARIFKMPAFQTLSAREKAAIYSVHATRYALLGDMTTARRWYRQAIGVAPTMLRLYFLLLLTFLGHRRFHEVARIRNHLRSG